MKRKRVLIGVLLFFAVLAAFIWANNTSLFVDRQGNRRKLLAHRGLAQTFDISQVQWDTNTAEIIYPPEHDYLENTIRSMRRAYALHADVVEFDVHRTRDDQLAVFHDYTVAYRTEAPGNVIDYTMAELKQLDIGYGYTADGGATYPFRGEGVGLMPVIDEVFEAFPSEELLIHIKDDDLRSAQLLWAYLKEMPEERLKKITVYGADAPIRYLRDEHTTLRLLSIGMMKDALIPYMALGWTGYVPPSLHNMELHLPLNYARLLWGWPHKFVRRMEAVNTRVVIVGGDGKASEGFDTEEDMRKIPGEFDGYVWTNRIDRYADERL